MPPRLNNAFEDEVDFTTLMEHSRQHIESSSVLLCWLVHSMSRFFGRLSVFDYAARVQLAEAALDNIKPQHRQASRITLERVITNLAPNPNAVVTASAGLAAAQASADSVQPLNDAPYEGQAMVKLRYALLKRAFTLYCDIGLETVLEDMAEEPTPSFTERYEPRMGELRKQAARLAEIRSAIYSSFPEDDLRSVTDAVLRSRPDLSFRDDLDANVDLNARLKEQEFIEQYLRKQLSEVLNVARLEVCRWQQRRAHYMEGLKTMEMLRCSIVDHLNAEANAHCAHTLKTCAEAIEKHFQIAKYFPEPVLKELSEGAILHQGGRL